MQEITVDEIHAALDSPEVLIQERGAYAAIVRGWIDKKRAKDLFELLRDEVAWEESEIRMWGRTILQPRLVYACHHIVPSGTTYNLEHHRSRRKKEMQHLPAEVLVAIASLMRPADLVRFFSSCRLFHSLDDEIFRKGYMRRIPCALPATLVPGSGDKFYLWIRDLHSSLLLLSAKCGPLPSDLRPKKQRSALWRLVLRRPKYLLWAACATRNLELCRSLFKAYGLHGEREEDLAPYIRLLILGKRFDELERTHCLGVFLTQCMWNQGCIPEEHRHLFKHKGPPREFPALVDPKSANPGPIRLPLQASKSDIDYLLEGFYSRKECMEVLGLSSLEMEIVFSLKSPSSKVSLGMKFLRSGHLEDYLMTPFPSDRELQEEERRRKDALGVLDEILNIA